MSATWYPPTDDCPGPGVPVLVNWAGRELRAMRRLIAGRRVWFCYADGRLEELPPVQDAARWGEEPDAWRPIKPELWKAPLPEPLATCAPRMWSSRTKFQAVDDAEAADLAREMEADREAARAGGPRRRRKDAPPEPQWWLDPILVTRGTPPNISRREAEGRLMRAFIALRAESMCWGAGGTFADVLAGAASGAALDRADATSDGYVFAQPTSADGGEEMLRALGWFTTLRNGWGDAAIGAFALELRSIEPALTWRAIARQMRRSEEDARYFHGAALDELVLIANGRPTEASRRQAERLEAVRGANRRHKIASRGNGG